MIIKPHIEPIYDDLYLIKMDKIHSDEENIKMKTEKGYAIRTWLLSCVGDIADGSDKIVAAGPWYRHDELKPIQVIAHEDHVQIVNEYKKEIQTNNENLSKRTDDYKKLEESHRILCEGFIKLQDVLEEILSKRIG